jgi:hypothetical protein
VNDHTKPSACSRSIELIGAAGGGGDVDGDRWGRKYEEGRAGLGGRASCPGSDIYIEERPGSSDIERLPMIAANSDRV